MGRGASRRRLMGGLLVGGSSERMGRPKALIQYRGSSFAERIAAALAPHVEEIRIIGEGEVAPALAGHARIADAPGTRGPIAGLLAALRSNRGASWLIAACDLPLVSAEAVGWLVAQRRADAWAVLPSLSPGTVEPLLALYEPEALALLEDLARTEKPAPSALAGSRHVVFPTPPRALAPAWRNVNTGEDLDALP
ncbi:MAG: molybdenum cofactor guanylyltransferase [Acidobacteriota bacterium]|nr:molybdenum cofactor guanylyltransferase [Acidobacteriota bacterium]